MSLFQNLKLLWQNRAAIGAIENAVVEIKNDAVKDGWKTSEFWGKTIIQILSVVSIFVPEIHVDPTLVIKIVAGFEATWMLYRSLHKANPPQIVTVAGLPAQPPAPPVNA